MECRIKKGGRRELKHLEPMLDFFYAGAFFLKSRDIVSNFKNGLELLILKDESERDLGFAIMSPSTVSKRALIIAMGLYPMPENKGSGRGREFLKLLEERYKENREGLLFFLPKSEALEELRAELTELPLEIFFHSMPFGFYAGNEQVYEEVKFRAEEELRVFMLMLISASEYTRSFKIRSLI